MAQTKLLTPVFQIAAGTSVTPTAAGAVIVADIAADWTGLAAVSLLYDVGCIDDVRLELQYSIDAGANWTRVGITDPIVDNEQTDQSRWWDLPAAAKAAVTLRVLAVLTQSPSSAIKVRYLETDARSVIT